MTASVTAPASGPVPATASSAGPSPPTDRLAFAALLDSLPASDAKAGSSPAGARSHPPDNSKEGESAAQPGLHPGPRDGVFFSLLPFAFVSALPPEGRAVASADASSLAPASANGAPLKKDREPSASGASPASLSSAARLVGERTFHFGRPAPGGALAQHWPTAPADASPSFALEPGPASDSALVPVGAAAGPVGERAILAGLASSRRAATATPSAVAEPSEDGTVASVPTAPHAGGLSPKPSANGARATMQEAIRSARKLEAGTSASSSHAENTPAPPAAAEPGSKAADPGPADTNPFGAPSAQLGDVFGAQASASFAAGPSLVPYDAPASTADIAPRARAPSAASTTAPLVREIDVDLAPGGLEDVSMTMRLAGDKLSVVIRAASSQSLGSIEGARDAIADRLAAIGQPLAALTIQQTGSNADANANNGAAHADEGSGGERRSGEGAGEQGQSGDPRRGAHRDLRF